MDKVTFVEYTNPISGVVIEHAIIDRGDGEFTSMPKSVYDEMIAKANEAKII
jgi:hypothetical protein